MQARFAQSQANGDRDETRGLIATNPDQHAAGSGVYTVKFAGDLSKCAVVGHDHRGRSGEITATPAVARQVTTVTVRTANSAGAAPLSARSI